ncbi:MAG TPA: lysophospholipid acyltransferase family protein [Thermodesulfobacteriota bacterium]|nr:lysophospholipid acyltransferase family protein [Thermodesulfobacteriota bacterium]
MLYELLRFIFTMYFRVFHSLEITGKEHIPADGPVILCANHSSYFDSMLVGLCTRRKVRFIIYDVFYHHWFMGPFIRALNSIPVTADGINKEALKKSRAILKNEGVIGIFPEGRLTRTGLPGPAEQGAALLAALSNAPIVPITIIGAYSVYPKGSSIPKLSGKITVMVHSPVKIEQTRRREEGYLKRVTNHLMEIIKSSLILPNP